MILAIDCGNTRAKWGLRDAPAPGALAHERRENEPATWRERGARALAELGSLESDWSQIAQPTRIAIANVAGPLARRALERALRRFQAEPLWVTAQASQCGVTNGYADPSQLGADRWAALIGAWHLYRGPSLVVTAGTATTVDMLSSGGLFRGGLILPGIDLMKKALAENTAGLALARGVYAEEPRNTADAIESGCAHAQAGAIERVFAKLEAGAICFLSGGAAQKIAGRLNISLRVVDNLALEGLARIVA
ncbi:MAG: type III pantothenate kinase [Betaproteobacteria bacterium]|nr:type III pantothenate kinase [Betaproteobacteria bacterium]